MGTRQGYMEFIEDLPLYKTEAPYLILPKVEDGWLINDPRLGNLKFTTHKIPIYDMRGGDFNLENAGFQMHNFVSKNLTFNDIASKEAYMMETQEMLYHLFDADFVRCYDCVVCQMRPYCN